MSVVERVNVGVKKAVSPVVATIIIVLVVLVVIVLMWKFTQPVKIESAHGPQAKKGGMSIDTSKAQGKVPSAPGAGAVSSEQPAETAPAGGQ
jgi:flagellin-like protein